MQRLAEENAAQQSLVESLLERVERLEEALTKLEHSKRSKGMFSGIFGMSAQGL